MTVLRYDAAKRCCALAMTLVLMCVMALPAHAGAEFDSLADACAYLRECTENRDEYIVITLSEDAVNGYDDDALRTELVLAAPLLSRLFSTHRHLGGSVICEITPTYRAGVRMADAWSTGDLSALSAAEAQALQIAENISFRLREHCDSTLELERAIFDVLCANTTYVNTDTFATEYDTPIITATNALLYGEANCQGYSDAFYLLASLCGLEAGFQNGYDANGASHVWNTIRIDGNWYAVDVTAADSYDNETGEALVNYARFNAGLDMCKGKLSWPDMYQSADIIGTSDENYFFYSDLPGFGRAFDDMDLMCRYIYQQRAEHGYDKVYALLRSDAEFDMDRFHERLAHVVEDVFRHPRATSWRVWYWPNLDGSVCLLLHWNEF